MNKFSKLIISNYIFGVKIYVLGKFTQNKRF